jgi:hypothetical protein
VSIPAVLFGGMAGFCIIAAVWFTVEAVLLWRKEKPITWYIRNVTSWHPSIAIFVIAGIGFAAGAGITHFVLDVNR